MVTRDVMISLNVTAEERAKLRAIAEANDESAARTVRRWIATFYRERFGEQPPTVKVGKR